QAAGDADGLETLFGVNVKTGADGLNPLGVEVKVVDQRGGGRLLVRRGGDVDAVVGVVARAEQGKADQQRQPPRDPQHQRLYLPHEQPSSGPRFDLTPSPAPRTPRPEPTPARRRAAPDRSPDTSPSTGCRAG